MSTLLYLAFGSGRLSLERFLGSLLPSLYRDFLTDLDKLMLKYIGLANPEHLNHIPIV